MLPPHLPKPLRARLRPASRALPSRVMAPLRRETHRMKQPLRVVGKMRRARVSTGGTR